MHLSDWAHILFNTLKQEHSFSVGVFGDYRQDELKASCLFCVFSVASASVRCGAGFVELALALARLS